MKLHRLTSQANTKAPGQAPHSVSVLVLFVFELCTLRAPQGLVPVQATKKSGTKIPLKDYKKLDLSAVITFRTHLTPVVTSPCRASSDT